MFSLNLVSTGALVLLSLAFAVEARSEPIAIVALGDSNTAGFGVARQDAFPAQLEALLRARGYEVQIANAGISGDTTRGMLKRLDSAVPEGTQVVLVQGGYNDLRRGSSPAELMANLDAILKTLKSRRIKAILCGLYDQPWGAIARRSGAIFVAGATCYDSGNRGFDRLHMSVAGHRVVAERLRLVIESVLAKSRNARRNSQATLGTRMSTFRP